MQNSTSACSGRTQYRLTVAFWFGGCRAAAGTPARTAAGGRPGPCRDTAIDQGTRRHGALAGGALDVLHSQSASTCCTTTTAGFPVPDGGDDTVRVSFFFSTGSFWRTELGGFSPATHAAAAPCVGVSSWSSMTGKMRFWDGEWTEAYTHKVMFTPHGMSGTRRDGRTIRCSGRGAVPRAIVLIHSL